MIVVLGMHKSGTSLVAEMLHHSGVDMGDFDLVFDYDDGNKFERKEFREINDALLGSPGVQSQDVRPVRRLRDDGESRGRALEEIRKLREKHGDHWGFKDPRTCFTLEFWDRVLPGPGYVFIFRDPREVAQHYYKRFKSTEATVRKEMVLAAMESWYLSNKACLEFLGKTGRPFAVFRYRDLLEKKGEMDRLALLVGRPLQDRRKPELHRSRRLPVRELEYYTGWFMRWKIRRLYRRLHQLLRENRRGTPAGGS